MPPPKTGPTTTVVRLPKAQVAAAEAATGLRGGQAVRAVLDGATTTEDRLLTLEELAVLTDRKLMELQAAIARLEGSRSLTSAPESPNPCPDMPPGGNGATMAVEAQNG